ncbi:hypothetical protein KY333_04955, partial [Candidatus Woesearchaeota archaeon]|nr:hypothetical protein [Candidatus Woesearchaeota archaeon]
LSVEANQIPGRAKELFDKWKKARKAVNKNKKIDVKELELTSKEKYKGEDVLQHAADLIKSQVPHLLKSLTRFKKELEEFKGKLK